MLKKMALAFAAAGLTVLIAPTATPRSVMQTSFLPPNDMRIPVSKLGNKGITQEQYNAVMDRVEAIYAPIIAARGATLVVNRLWENETVNASAEQRGRNWIINMYGGLARHHAITQDGMALVACHELGHHIGGAPKYGGTNWASNEGESDYFANAKCLHRIFADPASSSFSRMASDDEVAKKACAESFKTPEERAICERSAAAGMSVTQLFRDLRSEDPQPHFDTPDPKVVRRMYDAHPGTQCRLDTYYQGSLCAKPYTVDMDDKNPVVGACVKSQGYTSGLRPRCWYLPSPKDLDLPAPPRAVAPPTLRSLGAFDVFRDL